MSRDCFTDPFTLFHENPAGQHRWVPSDSRVFLRAIYGSGKARVFLRFRYFFSLSPDSEGVGGKRKKVSKSEETLVSRRKSPLGPPISFLKKKDRRGEPDRRSGSPLRSFFTKEKRSSIFFFVVPRKFYEFSGDPTSAVENRLRFSTAEERLLRFRKIFFPSHLWLGEKHANRRRPVFSNSFGIRENEGLLNMYIFFFRERPNSSNLDVRLLYSPGKEKSKIAQKIACDFLSDHGFVFAPKRQRQIQDFFFLDLSGHRSSIGARRNPSSPPIRVFFSSAPAGQREKNLAFLSDSRPAARIS